MPKKVYEDMFISEVSEKLTSEERHNVLYTNKPKLRGKPGVVYIKDIPQEQAPKKVLPKPADKDLDIFSRWSEFKKDYINTKFGGVSPGDIDPEEEAKKAQNEYIESAIGKYGKTITDKTLFETIGKTAKQHADSARRESLDQQKRMTDELNKIRGWFEKDIEKEIKRQGQLETESKEEAKYQKRLEETRRYKLKQEIGKEERKVSRELVKAKDKDKGITPTEKRMIAKDVKTAEKEILENIDDQVVAGTVDFFNEYSRKPYIYVWERKETPGAIWGTNVEEGWRRVDISTKEKVKEANISKAMKIKLLTTRF